MPAATLTVTFAGSTINIANNGNVTMTGGSGSTLTMVFANTTVMIDSSGNVSFRMATGAKFDISTEGGGTGDSLALVSALVSWLATHTHGGVESGGNHTAVPDQAITAATIKSQLIGIEN